MVPLANPNGTLGPPQALWHTNPKSKQHSHKRERGQKPRRIHRNLSFAGAVALGGRKGKGGLECMVVLRRRREAAATALRMVSKMLRQNHDQHLSVVTGGTSTNTPSSVGAWALKRKMSPGALTKGGAGIRRTKRVASACL